MRRYSCAEVWYSLGGLCTWWIGSTSLLDTLRLSQDRTSRTGGWWHRIKHFSNADRSDFSILKRMSKSIAWIPVTLGLSPVNDPTVAKGVVSQVAGAASSTVDAVSSLSYTHWFWKFGPALSLVVGSMWFMCSQRVHLHREPVCLIHHQDLLQKKKAKMSTESTGNDSPCND